MEWPYPDWKTGLRHSGSQQMAVGKKGPGKYAYIDKALWGKETPWKWRFAAVRVSPRGEWKK